MRSAFLSRLITLGLCATLAGCGYFIPPVKNSPRYNEVIGEPRHPELNPSGGAAAAPVTDVAQANLYPPVSDATRMEAQAAMTAPPAVPVVNDVPMMARHVPEENASANENSGYPVLNSVPASPATEDREAAARLARVRAQLEDERTAAGMQKTQLNHDAAAEPSLVPVDNGGAVPPPDPVVVAPVAPPAADVAPMPAPVSVPMKPQAEAMPITNTAPTISSALPPPLPLLAAPPQPAPQAITYYAPAQTAPTPVALGTIPQAPVPMAAAAPVQEPIILHPPQASAAPAPSAVPYSSQNYAAAQAATAQPLPQAAAGGFNPLEGATSSGNNYTGSSVYGSTGYLPASRYAHQRDY